MTSCQDVCFGIVTMATLTMCFVRATSQTDRNELQISTACYGTRNNYLHLDCRSGGRVALHTVLHGAKLLTDGCSSPANEDTYKAHCCVPDPIKDCEFAVTSPSAQVCENQTKCDFMATWSTTTTECDQDMYPLFTHYMVVKFQCVVPGQTTTTPKPSTSTVRPPTNVSMDRQWTPTPKPSVTDSSSSTTPDPPATQTSPTSVSLRMASENSGDDEQLSDTMIAAIVAGSVGMVLTLTIFICYWGSKRRRLRIVTKPAVSVWDYLLSQTFTVRGALGYDQFPSVRSSTSSDGDQHSPVIRKNLWLPNIAPHTTAHDAEVLSNWDNDSTSTGHRVELHPAATPSPYAILNLDYDNNLQHNPHHHDA